MKTPCPVCGTLFVPFVASGKRGGKPYVQRTCSLSCAQRLAYAERNGTDPKAPLRSNTLRWREKNAKRRIDILSDPKPYTLTEIARRDGRRCGLCRRPVDMTLSGLDAKGPTIDHIVPLSVSRDDRRTNVQLTHRICNLRKKDRQTDVQLMLIG